MAITLVSPIDPGIRPIIMSAIEALGIVPDANCPRGVAAVKASGSVLPKPHIELVATHTRSPVIALE